MWLLWPVSIATIRSELSLRIISRIKSANVGLLLEIFFSHAVRVQMDLLTKTAVYVCQPNASHEAALPVSQSVYVLGKIVSN